MRRSVWIFLAAIVMPSIVLAWLAVHSVRDQQVILEHQQAIISQSITDSVAQSIPQQVETVRHEFEQTTQRWLDEGMQPLFLAEDFNRRIEKDWPLGEIGFAVDQNGIIYSPRSSEGKPARQFRDENDRFLSNRENAEIYFSNQNSVERVKISDADLQAKELQETDKLAKDKSVLEKKQDAQEVSKAMGGMLSQESSQATNMPRDEMADSAQAQSADTPSQRAKTAESSGSTPVVAASAPPSPALSPAVTDATTAPAAPSLKHATTRSLADAPVTEMKKEMSPEPVNLKQMSQSRISRQVAPQQSFAANAEVLSQVVPEESDFRRAIAGQTSGTLARFLNNKLKLLVWYRPASAPTLIFGAQLNQTKLIERLKAALTSVGDNSFSRSVGGDYCLAILNDTGQPVALSKNGFKGDWKHPFVATEIGEVLPHWEVALYWLDPQAVSHSAETLQWTLGLIVLVLVTAIVMGGYLIGLDVRRQTRLAQQKTDFVSNVSHELKTPLTSIRMFADLLSEKRVQDEEKQQTYLRIISAEAARLTRLINNVLDFARMERGASPGKPLPCDLMEIVREVTETCRPHLEANGIAFQLDTKVDALPLLGQRDSLAQIILNLLSNAEKYGGNDILVRVCREDGSGLVEVLDRGPGIAPSQVKTIFKPFHRLEDSLASGIPGSGLGLTLAQRLARQHGGDILYTAREGGGSCFTLSIPIEEKQEIS